MNAIVLAIGTELTTGQTQNTHGTWIAQQLKKLGIECLYHVAIPDDRSEIQNSLNYLLPKSDLIFVTGGLGPTEDDFTREEISKFLNKKLVYQPEAWDHIVERLASRGVPARENQKQQCYFPEGAQLLKNEEGTAYGFAIKENKKSFYILPGPPRELQHLWKKYVQADMQELAQSIDPIYTKIWDLIGIGEGEIAHFIDQALASCKKMDIGYRAHAPYVEIKLTYPKSQSSLALPIQEKLHQVLLPYLATEDGVDVIKSWYDQLDSNKNYFIIDELTEGYLFERISKVLPKKDFLKKVCFSQNLESSTFDFKNSPSLILKKNKEVYINGELITIKAPYSDAPQMLERSRQYITEMAFFKWREQL